MDDNIDFSILEKAGISQAEFADLCGVSRVTVNLWVKGKMQPHRYLRHTVARVTEDIQVALDAGRLPVDTPFRRVEKRKEALSAALFPITA